MGRLEELIDRKFLKDIEFLEPIYDHIQDKKLKSSDLSDKIRSKMIRRIEEFQEINPLKKSS